MLIRLILIIFLTFSSLFAHTTRNAHAQEAAKPVTSSAPQSNFSALRETDTDIVTDVIDPLTLRLKSGTTITLTGLDYPDLEYHNPGELSLMAVKILKDMLLGKSVKVYQSKNIMGLENRMGHRLAHLERSTDKIWVQGIMLRLGLARVRTTPHNDDLTPEMLALEQEARAEKIGLWAVPAFGVHTPDTAEKHIGSFQIVEGTIQSVSIKQNQIFLNFGANWRDDFTITITPTNRRAFRNSGIDFQSLGGKTVRVRGWMGSYNGPYIDITHPGQLEFLDKSPQSAALPDGKTEIKGDAKLKPDAQSKRSISAKGDALPVVLPDLDNAQR